METILAAVLGVLRATRFRFTTEADLQAGLAAAFARAGLAFEREARLGPKDRIDFLLAGGVGVEVKLDPNLAAVTRQLHRYAQHEAVGALVLVTSRLRLTNVPDMMHGKPLRAVALLTSLL